MTDDVDFLNAFQQQILCPITEMRMFIDTIIEQIEPDTHAALREDLLLVRERTAHLETCATHLLRSIHQKGD